MLLRKGVLKTCSKFIGDHPCQNVISIKLLCNFIEIILWHGWSPINMLDIFRTPFPRNTSGWLLLYFWNTVSFFYRNSAASTLILNLLHKFMPEKHFFFSTFVNTQLVKVFLVNYQHFSDLQTHYSSSSYWSSHKRDFLNKYIEIRNRKTTRGKGKSVCTQETRYANLF